MQKHPSVKAINISLATFDVENSQNDENIIEEGILKQLFYKVDAHKIPQSRYRKLRKISIISYIRNIRECREGGADDFLDWLSY